MFLFPISLAITSAKSIILNPGIFITKISPPTDCSAALKSSPIASSKDMINLVILLSVKVIRLETSICFLNKGITLPLEPMTLPALIQLKTVFPILRLALTISLSDAALETPYKLIGFTALSVETYTTLGISFSIAQSTTF